MRHALRSLVAFLLAALAVAAAGCAPELPPEAAEAYAYLPDRIDFNYHVKPILSDRCFTCHGPDEEARKADLRLDLEDEAFARLKESGNFALRPGSLRRSQVYHRIVSGDPEFRMPPPESKLALTPEEIAVLTKWIEQGAEYRPHWAFIPPVRPEPPEAPPGARVENPIDRFILAGLAERGLVQAPEAGRERLLRRVTFDLTGLPPTVEEIDAFLADTAPGAYERAVDRLLGSDAHAERMTMEWLDVARYADSHGLHADGWRNAWPWRDWVIRAFRANMPYDRFVTTQLAGDMLSEATRDDILATAFHRNHPMTAEGGVIDEEFRVEYVADRTNTTATAFLGLTMECARCHDHKYDPFSQKEYYRLSAFFNNVKELGMTGDDGNYGPVLLLPDSLTEAQIAGLDERIAALRDRRRSRLAALDTAVPASPPAALDRGLEARYAFDRVVAHPDGDRVDGNARSTAEGALDVVEGRVGQALAFDDTYDIVHLAGVGQYDVHEPFTAGLWVRTQKRDSAKTQTLLGTAGGKNNFWRGWDFFLDDQNRLSARLIHNMPHDYIHVRSRDSVRVGAWTHVAVSYDGLGKAKGLRLYLDGRPVDAEVRYDRLRKNIRPVRSASHEPEERAVRVAKSYRAFTGEFGIFRGALDEVRLYTRALSPLEIAALADAEPTEDARRAHALQADAELRRIEAELRAHIAERVAVVDPVPETMVMEEMPAPRTTYVLHRGMYDARRDPVEPGTPASVLAFPDSLPPNRLGLAKWLFLDAHPLTARVTVNRYWQMLFGRGLVRTPQDFGSQGALPDHPELLDWLAVEFRESGWDVRALLRLIVTSATYRQDSAVGREVRDRDPENVYLARGPSYRLPGEMIRDNALAASGLLVPAVGGESVRPYQPEGLWIEKGNFSHVLLRYTPDEGEKLYRRSMYTFLRRTSPHPAMTIFDQPSRDVCTVERERTNTPLQALVMLNDPQFVEAARVLAERVQHEGGAAVSDQIEHAFRLLTSRRPRPPEREILESIYADAHARFEAEPSAADSLLAVGAWPRDPDLDPARTAALALVSSTILNHDAAYMKR